MISRGLGSTLATPISTALLRGIGENHHSWKSGFQVAGGRYEQLIVYVGTCFAASAAVSAVGMGMNKQRTL
jgi:MCP family monocarboxylic acid transporter-like MFS transporter 10